MPDLFLDFEPEELRQMGNAFLEASKKKVPKHFEPSGKMTEGYQYLSGEIEDSSALHYSTYCNELYDVWKGWAPKFCSRPPNFMVRPASTNQQPLASCFQDLFSYRVHRFDYQQMILQGCQDAVILGIAYARHQWDEERGLTVTSRWKPQNIWWESTAKTVAGANHVIEKHTLPRWQFVKKFGNEVGWEVNAADDPDGPSDFFPVESRWMKNEKNPLDPIEYYLLWSRHGGHKRVYAFHADWGEDYLQPESRKANKNVGEEWPFEFDEGEWHLTPLIPTMLNDRIEGIAMWEVVRGQYLMYQNLLGASVKSGLQKAKNPILHPDAISSVMRQVEATGDTTPLIKYSKELLEDFPGRKIEDLVAVLDFGPVDTDLLRMVAEALENFRRLAGGNAVGQIQPGGVETAAEATKLADAAANRVADDQGAVERWVNKIGRKELAADAKRIRRNSVCKWKMPEDEDAFDVEAYGEINADEGAGPKYLRNVPYGDAVLLEKGPNSDKAALRMDAAREEKRTQAVVGSMMGDPEFQGMKPEDAEAQVPVTPEVEVRRKYGVPMLAEVEICNPGIEMFVPAEVAAAWPERPLTRREIDQMFQIGIEQGTSSANGKMQKTQSIGMVSKEMLPMFREMGLDKQTAAMMNAVVKAPEIQALDDCEVTEEEVRAAREAAAAAAQAAAEMEAAAKAPRGEDPATVQMQSDAEKAKAEASVITSKEKTLQIDKKNEGDAARNREKNEQQAMMMTMNRMNGVGTNGA
jgi:hypothetical protein